MNVTGYKRDLRGLVRQGPLSSAQCAVAEEMIEIVDPKTGISATDLSRIARRLSADERSVRSWTDGLTKLDGPVRFRRGPGHYVIDVDRDRPWSARPAVEYSVVTDHWLADVFDVYSESPCGNVLATIWGRELYGHWSQEVNRELDLCLTCDSPAVVLFWMSDPRHWRAGPKGNRFNDYCHGSGSARGALRKYLEHLRAEAARHQETADALQSAFFFSDEVPS